MYCKECKQEQEEISFCRKCGKCLYKHSVQIVDNQFPLVECECGTINFWD